MEKWNHSQVIFSLLQRRELIVPWCGLLESKQMTKSPFSWKEKTTGRVEGYPEANIRPQLQDMLEYFTPDRDAVALVRLAFEKGRLEKKLPPPPVPEKDHDLQVVATHAPPPQPQYAPPPPPPPPLVQERMEEVPPWNTFLGTIPEDMNLPTNVCDYDAVAAAFDQLPYELRHF
jgi:hypothetical protein